MSRMTAGGFGHGEILNRQDHPSEPRARGGACAEAHPLLKDARCQRLTGHPGRHAWCPDESGERLMEWQTSAAASD